MPVTGWLKRPCLTESADPCLWNLCYDVDSGGGGEAYGGNNSSSPISEIKIPCSIRHEYY